MSSNPLLKSQQLALLGGENLALALCLAVHADEYVNPPGGKILYSQQTFGEHAIQLTIQSYTPMTYSCGRFEFIPNLSILDVMMWNSPEQIKHYLDTFGLKGITEFQ